MPVQPISGVAASGASAGRPGPLDAGHLAALAAARVRSKKIRRAANVAAMSGWTMALFAGVTLLGVVFLDYVAVVLGIGLAVVAYNELRGAAMLRRFEVAGARRLGYNQIGLGALLVTYAGYMLINGLMHPMLGAGGASTGDAETDAMVGNLYGLLTYGLYGGLAVAAVVAPGLTALYYFTRGRLVRRMLEETPEWVIQALRAAH